MLMQQSPRSLSNSYRSRHIFDSLSTAVTLVVKSGDNRTFYAPARGDTVFTDEVLERRIGRDAMHALFEWIRNAWIYDRRFDEDLSTLKELLKMAQTPGHLKRMLPDVVDYMDPQDRRVLLQQTRASSMPFAWAAFDRDKVNQLATNMARCKLLPEDSPWNWTARSNLVCTWPGIT